MNYTFNPALFKALFETAINDYKEHFLHDDSDASPGKMIVAMTDAINIMAQHDIERAATGSQSPLESSVVSEIGDYTLSVLERCLAHIEANTGQQARDLMYLSLPVTVWIARQGGRVNSLEMVVNSIASFANEIQDTEQLAELCLVVGEIIAAATDTIKQDLESTDPLRPWRVINMNYGIIATRSLNPELMGQAYDVFVKNLPQDARAFFKEGIQQMDVVGYPDEVRVVVEKYDKMWGSDSTLH